jgi:hypothetical protein
MSRTHSELSLDKLRGLECLLGKLVEM